MLNLLKVVTNLNKSEILDLIYCSVFILVIYIHIIRLQPTLSHQIKVFINHTYVLLTNELQTNASIQL